MGWSLLLNWRTWAVLGYVALAGWGSIQTMRLDWAKTENKAITAAFESFKAQTKAQGEIAQQKADLQAKQDLQRKERADHENKATVALLNQRISSLRYDREHTHSYELPAADSSSKRPDLVCFDRTEYSRADGSFISGARQLADEGDSAALSLNTACEWARGR